MPVVLPGAKVLVSGANGYIAIWVVRTLLDKGYIVRGTVRSADKGEHLKKLFASYGDKHEVVIVEDITKDGAFDEAVKGVDAIEHTASPFHFKADDPEEMIGPAVKGTVGILQSALKFGTAVKRIVVTSSTAAVLEDLPEPRVFSEKDWNEQAIQQVKDQGKNASAAAKYQASKTLAEKAAWNFMEKNKSQIKWDLAVLNPPYVFGPVIHAVSTPSALNTSVLDWYRTVLTPESGGKPLEAITTGGSSWVDVRDLAEAHVLAIQKEEAGGKRIIVSKGTFLWQDWLNAAGKLPYSIISKLANKELPKGKPDAGSTSETVYYKKYDASLGDKLLGIKYKSTDECAKDTIEDFAKRGW